MTKPSGSRRNPQRKSALERADVKVANGAANWRHHPVVRTLGVVSELADQPQLYTICAITAAVGVVRGDAKLLRAGLRMLAAEWIATKGKSFVKHRVDRTRPHVPIDGGKYRLEKGDSKDSALNSFPSGHTAGAVAVARAYASEYPEHALLATTLATSVGLIQIPRCKHYLTDVGVGAAIGLAAGTLVAKRSG